MTRDARIDDYIASAAPFARPILERFRAIVHSAVPGAVETIKWGAPYFTAGGRILAGMAAFEAHAALIVEGAGERTGMAGGGMGHYGKIASIDQFPDERELAAALAARAAQIGTGAAPSRKPAAERQEPVPPADLLAALSPQARTTFEAFTLSQRREYVDWIVEAKRAETRSRRIAQAAEWLAEGKPRHWKYRDC